VTLSRTDRSRFAAWSFTIDRNLLGALLGLLGLGLVLSFAASPSVALKKGLPTYYFVVRHVIFAAIGAILMFAVSLLTPAGVRRLSLGVLLAALAGMAFVTLSGAELNGAQRWLSFGGYSLQPSEFAKPSFIVVMAWLFSQAQSRKDMPALPLAFALWALFVALLVMQPDIGQTALISATAGILYLLAGLPVIGAAFLALLGGSGVWFAYQHFGHVHARLDRFFNPLPFENFQIGRAIQSFTEGGFLGRGPGEGTIKSVLPDAHTDFIFAVVAEEYGVVACFAILLLYGFIVIKALIRAAEEPQAADRLAIQGLAVVFGLQALINMGVNVGLLPPKGMTLPFISAGGSSLLALALTTGMLLALTRRRADPQRLKKPRLVNDIDDLNFQGHAGLR
jgi:cell division protein FtsW